MATAIKDSLDIVFLIPRDQISLYHTILDGKTSILCFNATLTEPARLHKSRDKFPYFSIYLIFGQYTYMDRGVLINKKEEFTNDYL